MRMKSDKKSTDENDEIKERKEKEAEKKETESLMKFDKK